MEITMETDWGARGSQLTGAQVQAFIKGQLKDLHSKYNELKESNQSDYVVTDKESASYIKNKPEIVTVEVIPDENLKSYTNVDGNEIDFKIGDFIRYKNEEGKYVFYQISDITEDGRVVWSEGGGGGSIDVRETVRISLSSNQLQPDNSLVGTIVTVTDNEGTELFSDSWKGEEIHVKVTPLVEYTVSVAAVDGYSTPESKSYTAGFQGDRTVNMIYNSCLLTVLTSGLENGEEHTVSVKYDSTTKNINAGESVKVPVGVSVEVTTTSVEGYATPEAQIFTPLESNKTITLTYIPSTLKVIIDSNQQDKSDLEGLKATVTYNGSSVQVSSGEIVPIPMGIEVQVSFPELNGYSKPTDITLTNQGGLAEKTGIYNTEAVTVNVSADNAADCSGRTIKVVNSSTSAIIGQVTGNTGTFKIPFGVNYKVLVDDMEGYDSPAEQSFIANTATRTVSMQYVYNPIKKGYYILDDTVNDPATKVTLTPEVTEVLNWIRANSHRVLVKKTSEGVCKVIQLLDSDSTKYFDGTSAPITDTSYDVMMMMPEFWYTAESAGNKKWKIWFADGNPEDGKNWHKWDHGHLIGAYEAYNTGGKVYSVSGKASTGNVSQADFKQYARNKGAGYTIIDWQAHCIMAFLFYGYYSNTNCQSVCGSGTNSYEKSTGATNSLGMADTTTANGNSMSINFWGLENWWGNKYEWIDNVTVDARVWKITESDGSVRTAGTGGSSDGYASEMIVGDNLDLICKAVSGSETTGYCDYYYQSSSTSRVVRRSYSCSSANGGVACAYAYYVSSYTYSNIGSRLAFNGTIVEADSVSSFTA